MTFGTVIRTLVGAFVGALLGYVLGLVIEMLPGTGGMNLPALLAALGFLAGAALGILVSIVLILVTHGVYARTAIRWAEKLGFHGRSYRHRHWIKHGFACGAWDHYGYDSFAGDCKSEPYSVEDTLQEIDGYISYLEDLPQDRVASFEGKISCLSDRLNGLRASLHH